MRLNEGFEKLNLNIEREIKLLFNRVQFLIYIRVKTNNIPIEKQIMANLNTKNLKFIYNFGTTTIDFKRTRTRRKLFGNEHQFRFRPINCEQIQFNPIKEWNLLLREVNS